MKASGTLGTLLGFAVLFALAAGGYYLFKYVTGVFGALDPQVETLAGIASVVALLCAVIIAEGLKARGQGNSIAVADRARLYESLLACCCDRLSRASERQPEAVSELVRIEQSLALHGSSKVVAAYVGLWRLMESDGKTDDTAPALLARLLTEMRADLGRTALIRNENDVLAMLLGRDRDRARGFEQDRELM